MKKIILLFSFLIIQLVNGQQSPICLVSDLPSGLSNGLIHYYPFCGNSDDIVNGVNGTLFGASLTTDRYGNTNNAFTFDGNDHIALNDTFYEGAAMTELSYNVWFKVDQLPNNNYQISAKEGYWKTISLQLKPDGSVSFRGSSSGTYFGINSNANAYSISEWHMVTVTLLNGQLELFIDAVSVAEGPCNAAQLEYQFQAAGNSTATNYIGAAHPVSPGISQYLTGFLDDFGLWNRALSTAEITTLFGNNPCNTPAPTGNTTQTFCDAATIADIAITGTDIQWYDAATDGNLLSDTTALTSGQTVYASQTENGCESEDTLEVVVNIMDLEITASQTDICAGESVGLEVLGATQNMDLCSAPAGTLINGLNAYYSFCNNTDDLIGSNNGTLQGPGYTTNVSGVPNNAIDFDGSNDYVQLATAFLSSQQVSTFTAFTRFKTNSVGNFGIWTKTKFWQEVNIVITSDNELVIKWANNVNGNKYSIAKTPLNSFNTNEWTDVVFVYENSNVQAYVNGVAVTTSLQYSAQGGSIVSTSYVESQCSFAIDANSSRFGTRISGGSPQMFLDGKIDEFGIWNRALSSQEIQDLYNGSTSTQTNSSYLWSNGETTATINVTPSETTEYWVDVTTNGVTCREYYTITVNATPAPTGNTTQTFCNAATVNDLVATGNNLQWYNDSGIVLNTTDALADGQIVYASQTIDDCESIDRLEVTVTINQPLAPTGNSTQTFCNAAMVNNLVATGSNLQWYNDSGIALNTTDALADGQIVYASQTIVNCESIDRLEVVISITNIANPEGIANNYTFCLGDNKTLQDISIPELGYQVLWYDEANGGVLLNLTTILENDMSYYATYYDMSSGCESAIRLEIQTTIIPCTVIIYNALSLNDNNQNDYMHIEHVEFFPSNSLEIYNRDGQLLYQQQNYGQGTTYFRGKTNTKGVYNPDKYLPTGSYLYIFKYYNPYQHKHVTKKGFLTINSK